MRPLCLLHAIDEIHRLVVDFFFHQPDDSYAIASLDGLEPDEIDGF
jgi:hypothetical protein